MSAATKAAHTPLLERPLVPWVQQFRREASRGRRQHLIDTLDLSKQLRKAAAHDVRDPGSTFCFVLYIRCARLLQEESALVPTAAEIAGAFGLQEPAVAAAIATMTALLDTDHQAWQRRREKSRRWHEQQRQQEAQQNGDSASTWPASSTQPAAKVRP